MLTEMFHTAVIGTPTAATSLSIKPMSQPQQMSISQHIPAQLFALASQKPEKRGSPCSGTSANGAAGYDQA